MILIVIKEKEKRSENIRRKNSQGVNTERATNTKKRKKAEGKRAEKDTRQPQSLNDALQDYSTLMFL